MIVFALLEVGMNRSKEKTLKIFSAKAMKLFGTTKITRVQAKEHGLVFYWPGEKCGKGHLTFRYTKTCDCRTCALQGAFERNNPELAASSEEVEIRKAIEKAKYDLELERLNRYDYDYDI